MAIKGAARSLGHSRWRTENRPLWPVISLLCCVGLCQLSPAIASNDGIEKSVPGSGGEAQQSGMNVKAWETPMPESVWQTIDDLLRVGNRRLLDVEGEDEEVESVEPVQASKSRGTDRSRRKRASVSEERGGEGDEGGEIEEKEEAIEVEVERSRADPLAGRRMRRRRRQILVSDDEDQEGLTIEKKKKKNVEEVEEDGASESKELRRRKRGVGERVNEEGGREGVPALRQRRRRWTDKVETFVSKKVNMKKEKQRREVGSVRTEYLKTTIEGQNLYYVFLDYFKFETDSIPTDRAYGNLQCLGGACPTFEPCQQKGYEDISACSLPELIDHNRTVSLPPGNCPLVQKERVEGVSGTGPDFDPKCSHSSDYLRHESVVNEVFEMKNMYVNERGHVFNATHYFDRNGCGMGQKEAPPPFLYPAETTRVTVFDRLVNLANWNAAAFYHGIIELLPTFYLLHPMLHSMQGTPISHRGGQNQFMEGVGTHLIGLPVDSLNLKFIPKDELFFAKTVIQPFYQWCARPSKSLWLEFRKKNLVPSDGIPMFNPDWTVRRPTVAATLEDPIPDDWVVVLGKRYVTRGLAQSDEVEAYMKKVFTPERVEVFDGSLSILQAKELFNKARFYVGVHGAALTNMIFMPFNGYVFEMRPRDYENSCFHHLAEVCDLKYYLMLGDGNKDSHTRVNVTEVKEVILSVAQKMEEQMAQQ